MNQVLRLLVCGSCSLLGAAALSSCNSGSGSGSNASTASDSSAIGGTAIDPITGDFYSTRQEQGVVEVRDSSSGDLLRQREFAGERLGGLAVDPRGERLAVVRISDQSLTVLALPSLGTLVDRIPLAAVPSKLAWTEGEIVVVATELGLFDVDLSTAEARLFHGIPVEDTHFLWHAMSSRLYVAEDVVTALGTDGEPVEVDTRVRWFERDGSGAFVEGASSGSGVIAGPALALDVSWDGSTVSVGTAGGIDHFGADDLGLLRRSVDAGLRGVAFNPTSTRHYRARSNPAGNNIVEHLDDDTQTWSFPSSLIVEGSLATPDGNHLVMQRDDDGEIVVQTAFELQLAGAPTAEMGEGWVLDVTGPAGAVVKVFMATEAGMLYIDPPGTDPRRFFDVDGATMVPLSRVVLSSGDGVGRIAFAVPSADAIEGQRYILQAIAFESDQSLGIISNPLVVTARDLSSAP